MSKLDKIKSCSLKVGSLLSKEDIRNGFDQGELDALLASINKYARSEKMKEVWLNKKADAYGMTIDQVLAKEAEKKAVAKEVLFHNVKAHRTFINDLDKFKDPYYGLVSLINGTASHVNRGGLSLNALIKSKTARSLSFLYGMLRKNNVVADFKDNNNGLDTAKELRNETTNNPAAKRIADSIRATYNGIRQELLDMGITIPKNEDYIGKQVHTKTKLRSPTGNIWSDIKLRTRLHVVERRSIPEVGKILHDMSYARWRSSIENDVDWDKTLEDVSADKETFIKSFFESIYSGVHKKPLKVGSPFLKLDDEFTNLMGRRKLHFKDAEGWVKYNKDYGVGNVHDSVLSSIEGMAHSLATIKKLGTNKDDFMSRMTKHVIEKRVPHSDPVHLKRVQNYMNLEYNKFDTSKGLLGKLVEIQRFVAYTTLGHLGLRSIGDMNILANGVAPFGASRLGSMGTAFKNLFDGMKNDEARDLAERMGIIAEGSFGGQFSRLGALDSPKRYFVSYLSLVGKLSGVDRLDRTNIYTAGSIMTNASAKYLERHAFSELPKEYSQILKRYGINDHIWSVMKRNSKNLSVVGGKKYLLRDLFDRMSDKDVNEIIHKNGMKDPTKNITKKDTNYYRNILVDNYDSMINDQVFTAKTLPDNADLAYITGGDHRNQFTNALMRSVTLFMPFHVASIRRTLGHNLYRNGAEDLHDALFSKELSGNFKSIGKYMAGGMVFGYLNMISSAAMNGKKIPSITDDGVLLDSFIGGGSGFLYSSYMDRFSSENPLSFVSSIAGTPINLLAQEASIILKAAKGKPVGKSGLKLLKRVNPLSFYFIKEAMNKHFFNSTSR